MADNTYLAKSPSFGGARYLWVVTGQGESTQLYRIRAGDSVPYLAMNGIPIRTVYPLKSPEGSAWARQHGYRNVPHARTTALSLQGHIK